jgi:hypothetical protein
MCGGQCVQVWYKKSTLSKPDPNSDTPMWVNDGSGLWNTSYRDKFSEVHGLDMDPLNAPFDPEVVVQVGQDKRNGRLWIGDDSIDTVTIPSICRLCRGRKSSQPRIETPPTLLSVAMGRIQVCSLSLLMYISLHVFHCNIHDIARTKCRLRWRNIANYKRSPRTRLEKWRSIQLSSSNSRNNMRC